MHQPRIVGKWNTGKNPGRRQSLKRNLQAWMSLAVMVPVLTMSIAFTSSTVGWESVNWSTVNWTSINWTSINWTSIDWTSIDWTSVDWQEQVTVHEFLDGQTNLHQRLAE